MIMAGKKAVLIAKRLKITESAVSQWFAKYTGAELRADVGAGVRFLATTSTT